MLKLWKDGWKVMRPNVVCQAASSLCKAWCSAQISNSASRLYRSIGPLVVWGIRSLVGGERGHYVLNFGAGKILANKIHTHTALHVSTRVQLSDLSSISMGTCFGTAPPPFGCRASLLVPSCAIMFHRHGPFYCIEVRWAPGLTSSRNEFPVEDERF